MTNPEGATSVGPPLLALVIQHTDDAIHVRSTTLGYGKVARVLSAPPRIDWTVSLTHDSGSIYPHDLTVAGAGVDPAVTVSSVAERIASDGACAVLAYEAFCDSPSDGPLVSYRRSHVGPSSTTNPPWLVVVDYGHDDGAWFFASPPHLAQALAVMRSCRWQSVYERTGPDGPESFALAAGSAEARHLAVMLRGRGWEVWTDEYVADVDG